MTLVFATNNRHKLEEARQLLPSVYVVLSLSDIGFTEEIDETGGTLEENSLLKARSVAHWLQKHPFRHPVDYIFADDTGLEVEVLGNQPGVRTARYAGEEADDARNRQKLLQEMDGLPREKRRARFRTVVTLIPAHDMHDDNLPCRQVEGTVGGTIATEEKGTGGFGYDSLFIPDEYPCRFAELTSEQKNAISHRGRAIRNLLPLLTVNKS